MTRFNMLGRLINRLRQLRAKPTDKNTTPEKLPEVADYGESKTNPVTGQPRT